MTDMPAAGSTSSFLHLARHQTKKNDTVCSNLQKQNKNIVTAFCVLTCRHQDKRVLSLERGVNCLELIESELMKAKSLVEDLHHLLGVGEAEASEAIVGWISESGLCNAK